MSVDFAKKMAKKWYEDGCRAVLKAAVVCYEGNLIEEGDALIDQAERIGWRATPPICFKNGGDDKLSLLFENAMKDKREALDNLDNLCWELQHWLEGVVTDEDYKACYKELADKLTQ